MYTRVSLIKKNNNKKTAQLLTNTPSFFSHYHRKSETCVLFKGYNKTSNGTTSCFFSNQNRNDLSFDTDFIFHLVINGNYIFFIVSNMNMKRMN